MLEDTRPSLDHLETLLGLCRVTSLGVFSPHLAHEIAGTDFRQFSIVYPQILVDFQSISIDCCHFQSVSVSFDQF